MKKKIQFQLSLMKGQIHRSTAARDDLLSLHGMKSCEFDASTTMPSSLKLKYTNGGIDSIHQCPISQ